MLRAPSLWEFGGPGMTKSMASRAHDDNALDGLQMTGAILTDLFFTGPCKKVQIYLALEIEVCSSTPEFTAANCDSPELIGEAK